MLAPLATDLLAASVLAFLSATQALSYAAMLFAGTSPAVQAQGVVVLLTSCAVLAIVGARLSSLPFAILFTDGTLIAVLASVTSSMVGEMRSAATTTVAATLITTLALATIATGLILWLVGRARGGFIARYLPFQVIAGVLAASGWSLSVGGATVALGHPIAFAAMADSAELEKLLPAVLLALLMRALSSRFAHPAMLPAMIVASLAVHHLVFATLGWSIAMQREAGWLFAVPPHLVVGLPWLPAQLGAVDWPLMGRQIPELLALPPIAVICLLLNLGGIETATGTDSDADRDLRANGLAAILCGALGGVLGITSVNRTLLMFRMGVRGRRASVFGGLAGLVLPLLWPALLGLVPRPVLGSVLLFYGLGMLQEWGLRARRQLSWPEWLTVLVVLAIAVRFGLIAAAFAGLLLGCITFAVIYSRTSPIRARYRGGAARSFVDRSAAELAQLAAAAPSILVIHLDGFVFFGTASRLVDEVKREISATQGVLRHLVLDFADVGGIDGSARVSFERLLRIAAAEGIALVLTAMSESVGAALTTVPRPPQAQLLVARSLEEGLELCEERVLANMPPAAAQSVTAQLAAEFDCPEDAARFIRLLEAEDIPAGGVLMRQGEHSDDLLFIAHGRASVTVQFGIGTPMRVRSFGSGTMVGEIGFCLGLPRTATVQAEQDCRILRLSRAAYQRLEIEHPTVVLALQRAVMRRLANRLLDKDQLIAALMNGATRVSDPGG